MWREKEKIFGIYDYTYRKFLLSNLLGVPYLAQIYTENHATFPIQIYIITVQICGAF